MGLALLTTQNPGFKDYSVLVLNVILAATVFHEFIGPITSKIAIKKANEAVTS